jgi:hypothetical protein
MHNDILKIDDGMYLVVVRLWTRLHDESDFVHNAVPFGGETTCFIIWVEYQDSRCSLTLVFSTAQSGR